MGTKIIKEETVQFKSGNTCILRVLRLPDGSYQAVMYRDKAGKDAGLTFICPTEQSAYRMLDFIKLQIMR